MKFISHQARACLIFLIAFIVFIGLHIRHARYLTKYNVDTLENGFTELDHPLLLERLRSYWIHPPSDGPLHLKSPKNHHFSQFGQSITVDQLLGHKRDGFYVECGAADGETNSNSLFFERDRGWKGLLVEPDPVAYKQLVKKNRKAYSINVCLNTRNISEKMSFAINGQYSSLVVRENRQKTVRKRASIKVQCFTLYSIMKALGRNTIDFFSLDVEGAELGVLKTIPFSIIDIKTFVIEYYAFPMRRSIAEKRGHEINQFMTKQGYRMVKKTTLDLYYVKKERGQN